MLHLGKFLRNGSAYPLAGRIRRDPVRMVVLDRFQTRHQPVVFDVADQGIIEHVITVVMQMDLAAQILKFLLLFYGVHSLNYSK